MITLEQIRNLEDKVEKAVLFIDELKEENQLLKKKLENYQEKIDELEILITDFKDDQQEIEQGILNALQNLDRLEDDLVNHAGQTQNTVPAVSEDTGAEPDEIDDVENKEITAVDEDEDDEAALRKTEGELDIF